MINSMMDKLLCFENFLLLVLVLIGMNIFYNFLNIPEEDFKKINNKIVHKIGFFGGFIALIVIVIALEIIEPSNPFEECEECTRIQYLSILIIFLLYALIVIISKIAVAVIESRKSNHSKPKSNNKIINIYKRRAK